MKKLPWTANGAAGDNYRGDIAETYLSERIYKPIWNREHLAVKHYLKMIEDGSKILDMPFGTGRFVPLYLEKLMNVTGVDISSDMLKIAQQELKTVFPKLNISMGSADHLPFPDGSFDLIVCVRFIESIIPMKLVKPCLLEMRRLCRGYAIVRLNNRIDTQPPLEPPDENNRMGSHFYLNQVVDLLRTTGWQFVDSNVVQLDVDKKGQKRICLLKAIN